MDTFAYKLNFGQLWCWTQNKPMSNGATFQMNLKRLVNMVARQERADDWEIWHPNGRKRLASGCTAIIGMKAEG